MPGWDTLGPFAFQEAHRGRRQALLLRRPRIALRLLKRQPTEDAHELMRRGAVFSGDGRAGFAQPMRRSVRQPGLIAPLPHLVAEAVGREGLTVIGGQEGKVTGTAYRNDLVEDRKHR